jgi:CBS domain-containing protein
MSSGVVTIPTDATLSEAASILADNGIGGTAVVDGDGRVAGMVTETDLLTQAQSYAAVPRLMRTDGGRDLVLADVGDAYREGWARPVRDVMSWPVITVREEDPVVAAADLLVTHDVRRLPVLDHDKRPVGMVCREDILRIVSRLAAGADPIPPPVAVVELPLPPPPPPRPRRM